VISVLLAVLATAANAGASVLQRKAGRSASPAQLRGLAALTHQLRSKTWFSGIALMIVAFVLQAAALRTGSLAVVQPILAGELPLTLVLGARVLRRPLGMRDRLASVAMAAGLVIALLAAAPSAGTANAALLKWAVFAGPVLVVLGVVAFAGHRSSGAARAALLGVAAGGLFGVTATVMTTVTLQAQHGVARLFGTGYVYAMAVAGLAAVIVLQEAYTAGSLAAVQPGVTLVDPVVAVLLGVFLFGEQLRLGWLIPLELFAVALIIGGAIDMSRSPLVTEQAAPH